MRRLHLIFALVVVTAFVSAFVAERSRPDEPRTDAFELPEVPPIAPLVVERGGHGLSGTVIDEAGAPVAEVHVLIQAAAGEAAAQGSAAVETPPGDQLLFFTHTDANGAFELRHLPAGPLEALLIAPGRRTASIELKAPTEAPVAWRLGLPWEDLPPAPDPVHVRLEGRLALPPALAADAEFEGCEVALFPLDDEARWRGALERRVAVAADGSFAVEDLAVADHLVHVLPPWAGGGTWPYLVTAELGAERIERLAAGDRSEAAGLELVLDVGELQGRLFDTAGRPVEGALLRVYPADEGVGRAWPAASSDAEGRFTLSGLPAPAQGRVYALAIHAGEARVELQVEARRGARREVRVGPLATGSPGKGAGDAGVDR